MYIYIYIYIEREREREREREGGRNREQRKAKHLQTHTCGRSVMTNRNKVHNESRFEPSNNPTKSKRHFSTFSANLTTASRGRKYVIRHYESKQTTQWMTKVRSAIAKEQSKFPYTLKQTCKVQRPLEKNK